MTIRTRRALTVLAALALVVLSACGAPQAPPIKPVVGYVALGDSFTAVAGTGPFTDSGCLRSDADYPALVAAKLGYKNYDNVSCGGATSSDLTSTQFPSNGHGANPPQLEALTKDTKLVTLGMGLNNLGLSYYLLYACLPVNGKTPVTCKKYLHQPDTAVTAAIAKMGAMVRTNLKAIRQAAPKARVVLVGYPRLLPDGTDCASQVPLPPAALDRIRTTLVDVNTTLRDVAKRSGADYIDMYAASEGHDVCSADPWVDGQTNLPGQALAFHPYKAYHVAVADKIAALVGKKK
ncbi:MAG: Lipase 2 precursor [Marmoricola sp.]|nr:Lipase 2 precursor [Marmoricola sp.]